MSTTCETIVNAAIAKNTENEELGVLLTPEEAVGIIQRTVKGIYDEAARVNPWYFATSSTVAPASSAWAVPANARTLLEVQTTAGARVWVVAFTDRESQRAPRVYRLGARSLYTVGEAGDPNAASDSLVMVYSIRHPDLDPDAALDAAANTLDASWVNDYDDLVILPLAIAMAVADGRPTGEGSAVRKMEAELEEARARFLQELEDYDAPISSAHGGR